MGLRIGKYVWFVSPFWGWGRGTAEMEKHVYVSMYVCMYVCIHIYIIHIYIYINVCGYSACKRPGIFRLPRPTTCLRNHANGIHAQTITSVFQLHAIPAACMPKP